MTTLFFLVLILCCSLLLQLYNLCHGLYTSKPSKFILNWNHDNKVYSYLLKLSYAFRAGRRILTHTHWFVSLIDFAHLSMFAVVVKAWICKKKKQQIL